MPVQIELSRALAAHIGRQMAATFPNEGGGFLLGHSTPAAIHIVDLLQVANVFASEEQYHRYAMTPQHWARMEDEAEARGLTLVGYYHSHPQSPAIPSDYDRVHALPNFVYLITSVMDGQAAEMRVWWLRADRSAFDEARLIVTA
ncbi:MAG: M67 family metallopeptidase [Anaerolineae bacterium]|jgi:proteasome lid subunit RPN8/RPN11|nr:M67 family metallopeptidase [Anaerolineae bacterium]